MRPGLDKPGALPLLVLIVFSLLTLVPSLSNIYNLKFTDFPFVARQVPLIQDNADLPPDSLLSDTRRPWQQPAPLRPRGNRIPRSSRLRNGASTTFSEIATVENKSRSSRASESTFLFSRRARAFRTYFIQQLDDYQLLTHFSARNFSAKTANPDPKLTPSAFAPLQASCGEPEHASDPIKSNTSTTNPELQVLSQYSAWQQVCRAAIGLWDIAKDAPYTPALIRGANYFESIIHIIPQSLDLHMSLPKPLASNSTVAHTPKSHIVPGERQSTDAAGRHSPELHGSCMAVVIGLVAGIVWF